MGDLIRFVDSIDASPTVRLDLNDEVSFWVKRLNAPPPRLRRSQSENAMRDGISVGSSSYGSRVLTMEIECRKTTQDLAAVEIQKLWRELDRPTNILMYQPNGLTRPVFFRTFRSDASQLEDVMAQAAMRRFTVEVLAEPFALGLKESLGPFTVNNNPAAGSNGCYFDLPTILGDVAAPLVMWDDTTTQTDRFVIATRGTSALAMVWTQAESVTLGTDTTNPGGGPDAAMSGTGTNNYVRTSFATPSMATRLTWSPPASTRGKYRLLVFGRCNGAADLTLGYSFAATPAPLEREESFSIPSPGGSRVVLDLGILNLSGGAPLAAGYGTSVVAKAARTLYVSASRDTGATTFDWDILALLPCGGQSGELAEPTTLIYSGAGARPVVDSVAEVVVGMTSAGDPTAGGGTFAAASTSEVAGGFPYAMPGAVNRIHMVRSDSGGSSAVAGSASVTLAYWPRYLHVRPVSS